ncbi:MAG TPA: DUF934 domain-containing protein [Hydrogenophaga sp.]|uniref:DUF934 domain-containing protein n=1 Tax=Hydrogenophaga sp. TaxID=1904254 RepID=UPI002C6DE023|nr:DUF934 domain-containing protein [Hydrogenophaga sp.]HMN94235.1 DUF934 domain-containing protein [Hydrogenophaga sp.]HMP11828.1 DUF934 domain-containing protein [Hydrogenophaga sp.]
MNRTSRTIDLYLANRFTPSEADHERLQLGNDVDPRTANLEAIRVVELQFPRFTDGRAFSQAFLLRRRLGFTGEIRATGDVLVDQLLQMQRSGFTQAVLRADQSVEHARTLLALYLAFYQGDAVHPAPHFLAEAR